MAVGYLNERTRKIISMVLKQSCEISIKEIAEGLLVSVRTAYNEIDKANSWLRMKKLPELRNIRGKIQPFPEEEKKLFRQEAETAVPGEHILPAEDYIFTPGERAQIIVCQIILSEQPVYVESLMNTCLVSRNTIFADLQAVISQLRTYQLGLGYEKKKGYWIEGDAIRVRALFFLYFSMLESLVAMGKLRFLCMDKIEIYLERLGQIETELAVHYVRSDMLALAALLPVMERGDKELHFVDISTGKIKESEEFKLVEKYFSELEEGEQVYLTLHFLGGRLASYSKIEECAGENETVTEIAKNLIVEFERRACVIFENKGDLQEELCRHISASLYRYRFGIQIGNAMAEDIRKEYPYIFDIMRAAAQCLEQQIGVRISDTEVAYLAIHFGAHLEYAEHNESQLRVLIVCMNGVATGNMISHELRRILPGAEIVGVIAESEIENPQSICDIIITSVELKAVVPVIRVNPILNDFDRKNILNHPVIRGRYGFVDTDALFRAVKKYVYPEKYAQMKHELETFFIRRQEERQPVLNPEVWRLSDFLTEDRIVFLDSGGNVERFQKKQDNSLEGITEPINKVMEKLTAWERAIYMTAVPLLRHESITMEYVRHMTERIMEAGAYMFVTQDLLLAHASPKDGGKHIDFSIGIAPEGILFGGGQSQNYFLSGCGRPAKAHRDIKRYSQRTF